MSDLYRQALESRIQSGKVYLNNKQSRVTGYEERDRRTIVIVGENEIELTEEDNLILNGYEKQGS